MERDKVERVARALQDAMPQWLEGGLGDLGLARAAIAAISPQREDTGEAWFARNADRRNPDAFIRTDPAYFASECADAIVAGRLSPAPTEGVAAADRIAALESALRGIFAHFDNRRRVDGGPIDAPGHGHSVPGVWDDDNPPDLAGKPCEWCATWANARAALSDGGDHAR